MTLHDLFASLETRIQDADRAECAALIGELEKLKALAYGKLMKREPETSHEKWLDAQQVAERLNVPKTFVYEAARQGNLKAMKLGKYVRFTEQAVKDYQEKYTS